MTPAQKWIKGLALLVSLCLVSAEAVAAPSTPTGTSPGSTSSPGPMLSSSTVGLSWGAVSGATYYDLGVTDMATGALVVNTTTTGTNYTAALTAGKPYRWNVAACNATGCSSYTTRLYFQTLTQTTGNLTVTVRRSDTNAALAGATVALSGGPSSPPSQTTGGDGTTTFSNLAVGNYTVTASLIGFQTNNATTTVVANTTTPVTVTLMSNPVTSIPVVLVHGWGGNGDCDNPSNNCSFGQMKSLLEASGFTVHSYDYASLTTCFSPATIQEIAGNFWAWLRSKGLEGKPIDVVAHSMGGLVVRAYMAGIGMAAPGAPGIKYSGGIRKLVMIGTPNGGITRARVNAINALPCLLLDKGSEDQARQMRIGNDNQFFPLLNSAWPIGFDPSNMLTIVGTKGDLTEHRNTPGHCPDYTVRDGNNDGVVTVASAHFAGATQREVPYKHSNVVPCPGDGKSQAFIDSSSHLTFATLVPFLQNGTAPTLYTRRAAGGIWHAEISDIISLVSWHEVPDGALTPSSPAAAAAPNGDVYVVVQGIDNHIYINTSRFNGILTTWQGWTAHPSGLTGSSPTAVVDSNGNLQVFVHGTDDVLYQSTYTGGDWSEWREVPGSGATFLAPQAAVDPVTGALTLAVVGVDGRIYLNTQTSGNWSGWNSIPVGGLTPAGVGATYDASGTLWLVVRGIDNGIWVTARSGGNWSGWETLGGATYSSLAVTASGNTVYVFAHGKDDYVHRNTYSQGQWSGWRGLIGGRTPAAVAATAAAVGSRFLQSTVVHLFVRGM